MLHKRGNESEPVSPGVDFTKLFLPSKKVAGAQCSISPMLQISSSNRRTFSQIFLLFANHCEPKNTSNPVFQKKAKHIKFVDEINPWYQFHQRFTLSFYVPRSGPKA
jgi:hypothetical protein